jgi:hypothetical protein
MTRNFELLGRKDINFVRKIVTHITATAMTVIATSDLGIPKIAMNIKVGGVDMLHQAKLHIRAMAEWLAITWWEVLRVIPPCQIQDRS